MTSIRKVLVLGASGDQGLPLMDALKGASFDVVAGVRRADALAGTRHAGTPTAHADILDEDSLARAMDGVDALAMHLPFEFDRARAAGYGARIGAAARRSGLRKIVFNTSCFVADRDLGLSAHDGRRDIEAAIAASGADYVVIRPVVFMDNMLRIWSKPSIVNSSIFAYPASPTLKISWICLEDVSAFMTEALRHDELKSERILVGGPEALVGDEVAERLSEAAGRTIRFESMSPDAYASKMSLLVTGSPDVEPHGMYDRMAQFYRWYNAQPVSPLAVDLASALAKLPIRPTHLVDWARRQDWSRI